MSEIEEGAHVHFSRGGMHDYLVLARYGEYAWIREEGSLQPETVQVKRLTRIAPTVPQPKFRDGQDVLSPGGSVVKIIALGPAYRVEYPDGTHTWWEEELLSPVPVPEVCPTCGGKVADAD